MKPGYVLNLMTAIDWWLRPELGPKPKNSEHVAEVLSKSGIKVYKVRGGWLECELRPAAIYEVLSGKTADMDLLKKQQ